MKSLQIRFVSVFTVLILLVSAGLSFFSIKVISERLIQNKFKELQYLAVERSKYVQSTVETQTAYLESLAENDIIMDDGISWEEKVEYFQDQASKKGYTFFAFADQKGNGTIFNSNKTKVVLQGKKFYEQAMSGQPSVSDVLINVDSGKPEIKFAAPVRKNSTIQGVLYAAMDASTFVNIISQVDYGETGYMYLINQDGTVVAHQDADLVVNQYNPIMEAKSDPDTQELADLIETRMLNREIGSGEYLFQDTRRMVGFAPIEGTQMITIFAMETQEALQGVNQLRNGLLLSTFLVILLGGILTYFVSRSITRPILFLTNKIEKMSRYDLTDIEQSKYSKRKDEIGKITYALSIMRNNFEALISSTKDLSEKVSVSSQNLTTTSQQSAVATDEVARAIQEIATGASAQAEDAQRGAFSMEELGELLKKDQEHVKELIASSDIVSGLKEEGIQIMALLVEQTEENLKASKEVNEAIINTNESVTKIEAASGMIQSISDQTNLLALNAAIESARAGEAGKGFAVVAEEIRKLAVESNRFAEEIRNTISTLTEKTDTAVSSIQSVETIVEEESRLVEETKMKFQGISEAVEKTKAVIEKVSISEKEMDGKKDEVLQILHGLASIAEENAAGTQESSASAEELSASIEEVAGSSENLANLADELNKLVMKFKI